MSTQGEFTAEGGCACGGVRYRITSRPMFVHCCHCRGCQRETGAAFALNALIETECVEIIKGAPGAVMTPSESGNGQTIIRCPVCHVAVWSHYSGAKDKIAFIRVGTLDEPDLLPPDIHIYTVSKQPWIMLPDGVPAYAEFYRWSQEWSAEALARRAAVLKR